AIERALRLDGDLRHQRERRRDDAVEHDGTRALRKAARVVLRDPRPVGPPEHVDLLVAERGARRVEVADRDAGRVELGPAWQARQAVASERGELRGRDLAGL